MIPQTASKEEIKKAKKKSGNGTSSIKLNNLRDLAKIAHIYNR